MKRMSMMDKRTTLAAAALALMSTGLVRVSANADFYQFTFGGEVVELEGVIPEPWDGVDVGSVFEVSYIFDSEAEDQHWHDDIGKYAIISAEITVDGVSQITTIGEIEIRLDEQLYKVLLSDLPIGADGGFGLWGYAGTVETDELPLTLDLDDFAPPHVFTVNGYYMDWWHFKGHIETFSSEIIPAPASIALLGVGLLFRSRRKRAF